MKSTYSQLAPRLANTGLRVISMGSRFVLLIALSKFLEPSQVGLYGLFMATVIFSWQLLGGEIHNFGNRELLKTSGAQWPFVIQNMAAAILVLYIFLAPLLMAIFLFDLLPVRLALWFFPILLFDHLSQEMYRTLNFMGFPLKAGMVLLVRSGSWVWLALAMLWWVPETRNLESVFAWWLAGGILAVCIGGLMIYKIIPDWGKWTIDMAWVRRAYKVGLLFLISSLSFRALSVLDRYAMSYVNGEDLLGVYVFYVGLSMSVIAILEPAVLAFLQPKLVAAHYQQDKREYRRIFRELCWSSIGLSLALSLAVVAISPWILDWIDRPIYIEHLPLLWVLLGVPVAYAAGIPAHSGLYAKGKDRSLALANFSALVVFVIVTALVSGSLPTYAPAIGLIGALLWGATLRTWFYLKNTD